MNSNFFTLVGFEYKKILKRKSTYFAFTIILATVIISSFGMFANIYADEENGISKYEAMKIDRKYAGALKGDINEELLTKVIVEYQRGMSNLDNLITTDGDTDFNNQAYEKYSRPYQDILNMLRKVYAPKGETYNYSVIEKLTANDAKNFYIARDQKIKERLTSQALLLTNIEIKKHLQMNQEISLPLKYDYVEGYSSFVRLMSAIGIFITLAISICIAPIFSGEYSYRTDALLLTSKNGKKLANVAKIFTGVTFSFFLIVSISILFLFLLLSIYGFQGMQASIQALDILSTYPLTILQGVVITLVVITLACLLVSAITLLLSAYLKTPFMVIIVSNLILFVPLFMPNINKTNRVLGTIVSCMPTKMMEFSNIFSDYFFNIGGTAIVPYVFLPIFCILMVVILLPLSYRGFKNHQIG